ncbi:MAG: flavodoxin family protein [Candidatus Electrothrix sp. YB6]
MIHKTVILDGTRSEDGEKFTPVFTLLMEELRDSGTKVQTFKLNDIKINHCIGCFNCWSKTPGRCVHTADTGAEILQEILNSNTVIFFTPVVFGGYSSELKKIADRSLPFVLPFLRRIYGETHHPTRYSIFPRFVGIGVCTHPQKELSDCFRTFVGRSAANLETGYAAEVVSTTDSPDRLRLLFHSLLCREDSLPGRNELISLMDDTLPVPDTSISTGNRKVLLIIGSPKTNSPSTSATLGSYLLERLEKYGWKTASLTLGKKLYSTQGQSDLYATIIWADTIILSAPLYYDALPFLVTKAFEVIAARRESIKNKQPKNFLAIMNNGFPESYQNAVALSICRNFAMECGSNWIGGLALGAGEGLLSGHRITGFKGFRGFKRPPLYHVVHALDITAAALAAGQPVPRKAVQLMDRKPIPFIPFNLWRWMYMKIAKKMWYKEALENGITKEMMLDKPYMPEPD